jgi:8-oxo-dGTP pyrophosphatase MutT (NUDIX family)
MTENVVRVVDAYIFRKIKNSILFLLLKRSSNKIYEHLWQGVAGKIEKDETAWCAAIRELKEETGLDPKRMFIADYVSKFYEGNGDRINHIPVFGIEVESENVTLSEEHSDFKWVNVDEAEMQLMWNGQKKGIRTVYDMIKANDDRMRWSEIKLI